MSYQDFKSKVLEITSEATSLLSIVTNQNHILQINNLLDSFTMLLAFVNDNQNLVVLDGFDDQEQCPLDILCKNLSVKLNEIESLLKKEMFDYLRPNTDATSQPAVRTAIRANHNSQELGSLTSKLNDQNFKNLLSAYDILKHLRGHNKTLVILGPNGSGKTSFANHIKGVENHVKVMLAHLFIASIR